MTAPVQPTTEQQRVFFEYRALRSGLGQGDEALDSFLLSPTPKILKATTPGQTQTKMRFRGLTLNQTDILALRRTGVPEVVDITRITGAKNANKDLTPVNVGVLIVELTKGNVVQIAVPEEVDFLITATIQTGQPGDLKTMTFSEVPPETTRIILTSKANQVPTATRLRSELTGTNSNELAGVKFADDLEVELQALKGQLDKFTADVV